MLKFSMPADSRRVHPLAIVLSLVGLLLCTNHSNADRFKPRGVSIPDAPDLIVPSATHLDRHESGADLTLPLVVEEAWEVLNRVLADMGINPQEQDAQNRRLLSDWVLWVWDPDQKIGRSKPPRKALSRTYERHRFEFSVSAQAATAGTVIHVSDKARQREVDITPDSEYSWLQWQDAAVQADAAWSFMRRLQGNFESALSSRLVPSTAAAPRIIEPVRPSVPSRQVTEVTPTTPAPAVSAPAAVIVEPAATLPALAPVAPAPIPKQSSSNTSSQTKPPAVEPRQTLTEEPIEVVKKTQPTISRPTEPLSKAESLPGPGPQLSVEPLPETEPRLVEQAPTEVEQPQSTTAMTPPESANVQPAPTPLAVQGGLLVDGGLDATWQAVLPAIEALGITLQSSDPAQHMLTTQWIDALYDKKNQQLTLESKTEERWAFDLWGKGRERHRFQLILIPVDGGSRTMVYAYHTGFQEETDRTPDSSQTLLYWKDRKTQPAIAMAFLRRLQLVVKP